MRGFRRRIDEYTLAAYLSGRLAPSKRRRIAAELAEDEDALEIFLAARAVMEDRGDGAPAFDALGQSALDRVLPRDWQRLAMLLVMSVLVMLPALLIMTRYQSLMEAPSTLPVVVADIPAELYWVPDPDAVAYRITARRAGSGQEIGSVRVDGTRMPDSFSTRLAQFSGAINLRIEALGARGGVIARNAIVIHQE